MKYLFKWPDEAAWGSMAVLVGALVVALFDDVIDWPRGVEIATIALVIPGIRFIGGLVIPTPTVAQEIASVRESIDDKPEVLP